MNPLLSGAELPKFKEIRPGDVDEAIGKMVEEVEQGLARIEADPRSPSWDTVVGELNTLEEWFLRVWEPVAHMNTVMNSPALRQAYQKAQPKVVCLRLKLSQSAYVYGKLRAIRNGAEWERLEKGQKRAIEKRLLAAELAGIALEGEKQDRFNKIEAELSRLGNKFTENVMDAVKEFKLEIKDKFEAEGLTPSIKELLAQYYTKANPSATADPENGPWLVTLDFPVYTAFIQFAKSRALRERVYRAYVTRAASGRTDNMPGMAEILRLRGEKAALLGYIIYLLPVDPALVREEQEIVVSRGDKEVFDKVSFL